MGKKLLPVLMTASVDTRGMANGRYSAEEREKMYVETIQYYLNTICRNSDQRIVFCDNSGWDMQSIREKVGGGGILLNIFHLIQMILMSVVGKGTTK